LYEFVNLVLDCSNYIFGISLFINVENAGTIDLYCKFVD